MKKRQRRITVGLIIPYYEHMFSSFYTLEIIKEVSKAAIKANVDLLVQTGASLAGLSGVLFADKAGNEALIEKASKAKLPYIILNYYDKHSADSCIGIDNERACYKVITYLANAGHKRIGTITGKLNTQSGIQRLKGIKPALTAKKLHFDTRYVVTGNWTRASGKTAMRRLLALRPPPTAVFVTGDEMALGAIEAVREKNLNIPEDISIVGFDNIPQVSAKGIELTTVEQPFAELAETGLSKLIQFIRKQRKRPLKILLSNTKLIKRATVKVLRRAN